MSNKIIWTDPAEEDLVKVWEWFRDKGEDETGQEIIFRIMAGADRLRAFPLSGRPGILTGTRELSLPDLPYILVYQVSEHVEILRLFHTSRHWLYEFEST